MTRRLIAGTLVASGLLALVVGGYLDLASGDICENNPDCVPGWWWPVVLLIAAVLVVSGIAVNRLGDGSRAV